VREMGELKEMIRGSTAGVGNASGMEAN